MLIDSHDRGFEDVPLVGRGEQLSILEETFAEVERGNTASVCVVGSSGIGKTILVRYFTDSLLRNERAVVLAGRCYASETVPFKAFHGVMDRLSRLMLSLEDDYLEPRLPEDTAALTRLFPILRRVPAVERRASSAQVPRDEWELRRRAFVGFEETLASISAERPVVLHIDDLQWVDMDSAEFLDQVLRWSDRLRVLFVLSFRSEDVSALPLLSRLLSAAATQCRRVVELGPLSMDDASGYAAEMLADKSAAATEQAESLARESEGNPFLLDQMVRAVMEGGVGDPARPLGLREMLDWRLEQLPQGARALTEVLAVAGQPIDARVAFRAAGIQSGEQAIVRSLRLAHLLRVGSTTQRISLYHDEIGERLSGSLTPDRRREVHRLLATALEEEAGDDHESLYEHWLGAGERLRAAQFAARAALGAQQALAFERAAQLYEIAIELSGEGSEEVGVWYIGLGDARASAGRGAEAARAYLQAVEYLDEETAIEIERRAGQQYLISGRIREGLEVISGVLGKAGLPKLAPSPRRAFLALAPRRLKVLLRGLEFAEHTEESVPADQLLRIDTCWAVAEGMALVDNIQGAAFQTLHLLQALEAGEPRRVGRALAMEAGFAASSGASAKADRLLARAEQLAHKLGSRSNLGLCRTIAAVSALHAGRSGDAVRFAVEAERILSQEVGGSAWLLNIARVYHLSGLLDEGEIGELCRVSGEFLNEALDRGNLFAATMFRTGWSTLLWLAADDIPGARAALEKAVAQCPEGVFFIPHYNCLITRGMIDLYSGDYEAAYEHIAAVWPTVKQSLLLRIRTVRVRCLRMHAACAIAAAGSATDPEPLLAVARRYARALDRERHYSAVSNEAKGRLLRAGIAATRGDEAAALKHLSSAVERFSACGSGFWLAMARRRTGQVLGGTDGLAMVRDADSWMAGEGIRDPVRMTEAFIPGFSLGGDIQQTLEIRTPLGMSPLFPTPEST